MSVWAEILRWVTWLAGCLIILCDTCRFRVLKSIIQSNKTLSISRALCPPSLNRFLLVDRPPFLSGTLSSVYTILWSALSPHWTSLQLPPSHFWQWIQRLSAMSKDLCCTLLLAMTSWWPHGDSFSHAQVYPAFIWTPAFITYICVSTRWLIKTWCLFEPSF